MTADDYREEIAYLGRLGFTDVDVHDTVAGTELTVQLSDQTQVQLMETGVGWFATATRDGLLTHESRLARPTIGTAITALVEVPA